MLRIEHKHPRAIRWLHWINVPLLSLLIWSGLLIYWSRVMQFAGVRLYDFVTRFGVATKSGEKPDVRKSPDDLCNYAGFVTPDRGYYVGLDIASALHEQTLLCYEMNGEPLN